MKKQSSAYIEMLFENRNKEYGAYDLRVNYEKHLFISFFFALLIAGFFFLIPYVLTQILTRNHAAGHLITSVPYDLSKKYVIERPQIAKPVLASSAKTPHANTTYKVAKVVEDKKAEEQKSVDPGSGSSNNITLIGTDSSGTMGKDLGEDSIPVEAMSSASVDVPPSFPGGETAMMKFLKDNLKYTELAKDNKISGRVYVSFIIDEKGSAIDFTVMRSLGYGMDEEVIRVLGIMPAWSPGEIS